MIKKGVQVEEKLPKMKMIKMTMNVNGKSFEVWGWNRSPTEKERKRGLKRLGKIMDKVIERNRREGFKPEI